MRNPFAKKPIAEKSKEPNPLYQAVEQSDIKPAKKNEWLDKLAAEGGANDQAALVIMKRHQPAVYETLLTQEKKFHAAIDQYEAAAKTSSTVEVEAFYHSRQRDLSTLVDLQTKKAYQAVLKDDSFPVTALPGVDLLISGNNPDGKLKELERIRKKDPEKFEAITTPGAAQLGSRVASFDKKVAQNPVKYLSDMHENDPKQLENMSSKTTRVVLENKFNKLIPKNPSEHAEQMKPSVSLRHGFRNLSTTTIVRQHLDTYKELENTVKHSDDEIQRMSSSKRQGAATPDSIMGLNSQITSHNATLTKEYPKMGKFLGLAEGGSCLGISIEGAKHVLAEGGTLESFRDKLVAQSKTPDPEFAVSLARHQGMRAEMAVSGVPFSRDIASLKDGLHNTCVVAFSDKEKTKPIGAHAVLVDVKTGSDGVKKADYFDPNLTVVYKDLPLPEVGKFVSHNMACNFPPTNKCEACDLKFQRAQEVLDMLHPAKSYAKTSDAAKMVEAARDPVLSSAAKELKSSGAVMSQEESKSTPRTPIAPPVSATNHSADASKSGQSK